jgi:hypothetical protein
MAEDNKDTVTQQWVKKELGETEGRVKSDYTSMGCAMTIGIVAVVIACSVTSCCVIERRLEPTTEKVASGQADPQRVKLLPKNAFDIKVIDRDHYTYKLALPDGEKYHTLTFMATFSQVGEQTIVSHAVLQEETTPISGGNKK